MIVCTIVYIVSLLSLLLDHMRSVKLINIDLLLYDGPLTIYMIINCKCWWDVCNHINENSKSSERVFHRTFPTIINPIHLQNNKSSINHHDRKHP